ncbi:MAG: hypothetical protein WC364_04550 [Eubacteriales bacterium]|jgi:predicted S18 family serine protease
MLLTKSAIASDAVRPGGASRQADDAASYYCYISNLTNNFPLETRLVIAYSLTP